MTTSPRTLVRPAEREDAAAVAAIWNEGIEGRQATFETRPRERDEIAERAGAPLPFLVAELDGAVVGFALLSRYDARAVYDGVADLSIYVAGHARRQGIGTQLLEAAAAAAEQGGIYKLTGKLFTTNEPSVRLIRRTGFADVGVHRRHGKLDGEWRDVLLVERLIGEAARGGG